ncbi:MAG: hypothetical protein AAGF81_22570, partial [Pseudomonadota bacterium]
QAARRRADKFAIFGTAIAGTWLYGALEGEVDYFVDEDSARHGKKLNGCPILPPQDVPDSTVVFVPLAPATARKVADRLSGRVSYVVPPPLER